MLFFSSDNLLCMYPLHIKSRRHVAAILSALSLQSKEKQGKKVCKSYCRPILSLLACVYLFLFPCGATKCSSRVNQGFFLDTFPPNQLNSSWRFLSFFYLGLSFFKILLEFFQDFARVFSFFTKNALSFLATTLIQQNFYE